MKIGLFLALFSDRPLEEALDAASAAGCETVEIMSGSWSPHCRPAELLDDPAARRRFDVARQRAWADDLGALVSREPASPEPADREPARTSAYRDTVRLAAEIGDRHRDHVLRLPRRVRALAASELGHVLVAGRLPGDARVAVGRARASLLGRRRGVRAQHGVRVAIEPHPGFVVYNTASMLRLRESAGESVGVNFDPSHLFWQGMDPLACVRRARRRDLPRAREGHGLPGRHAGAERRARADPRQPPSRAELDLPLGRCRASRRVLARPRRALCDASRLRRRAVDRARGSAPLARRRARARRRRRCERRSVAEAWPM